MMPALLIGKSYLVFLFILFSLLLFYLFIYFTFIVFIHLSIFTFISIYVFFVPDTATGLVKGDIQIGPRNGLQLQTTA